MKIDLSGKTAIATGLASATTGSALRVDGGTVGTVA